ncbi:MAG: hypothetical protein Q4C71_05295, partial [Microbacteriaceae bacterium]|nr:hypothetical protein [Microbacteriaceae bacterium]
MSPFSAFETWSDLAALADGRVAGWLRFAADAVTPEERAGRDAVAEAGTAGRQGSNPASPVGENGSETHPETNPETGSDPTQDSVTQQNPADQTGTAAGPDTGTTAADGGFASSVATSEGLAFARQILQLLAGTQDPLLAALELRKATQDLPAGLSRKDKFALKTGAVAALGAPWLVLPVARRILRERLSSVLCVANLGGEYKQLAKAVTKHGEQGVPVSLALGGSAVLGPEGAERELKRLISLAQLPFVSRLLVDIGRLAPGNNWRHDARVTAAVTAARQLLEVADNNAVLVTFQATAYDDVRLLAQTATQLLQDTALRHVSFGVSVRAENPESAEFLTALSVHTAARSTAGGAPLEVRITCESTLSQESAASILSGLPVAVLESRVAREAAALQLLRTVFNGLGVRAVLASESAFLVAAALELQQLLATGGDVLGVELRAGVADTLAQVLVSDRVPVYTVLPLVENSEFDAAVPGLLRLLGEAADAGSAIAHKKLLDPLFLPAAELRAAESQVLEQVLARAAEPAAAVNRVQDRAHEWDPTERDSALFYRPQDDANMANTGGLTAAVLGLRGDDETGEIVLEKTAVRTVPVVSESGFSAEPGTDVSLMHNRDWLLNQIVSGRSESEEIADQNAKNAKTDGKDTKGEKSEGKKAAGKKTLGPDGQAADKQAASTIETDEIANGEDEIALLPHTQKELAQRVRALRKIALASVANRDTLTSQFAAATRLHAAAIDSQINYLIDSARYFALLGDGMQLVRGATFNPAGNVLIVCNNPEFTGEALVALLAEFAAGNSTALVASAPTIALAKHLLPDWHAAGYPADSLQLHQLEHSDIARLHATHGYARALLLGDSVLQESVTRLLPGLPVQGRFEQIGVAAITPAADIDTAAADAITSAFTGGDNGLRQVRAIVALGSVYKSKRFRQQLADAARAVPTAALHPAFHAGQTAGHTLTK